MSFELHRGRTPLLVSFPHSGTEIPPDIRRRLTHMGRDVPDTDWHVPLLYDFVRAQGAGTIQARLSRYVVDLNRPRFCVHGWLSGSSARLAQSWSQLRTGSAPALRNSFM